MKSILKDLFFLLNTEPIGDRESILSYHHIGVDEAHFTVRPEVFKKQMDHLKESGLSVVSLSELVGRLERGEGVGGSVAITLNDGHKSHYAEAFPILKEHGFKATLFLTAEFLDAHIKTTEGFEYQTLSQAELKEMLESGLVECMPETQHTVRLGRVPIAAAVEAIELARKNIESVTGKSAPIFAYPKGESTDALADYLKTHAWQGAVTLREGLVSKDADRYTLPRNSVDRNTSFAQFKGKLSGAIEKYVVTRNRI